MVWSDSNEAIALLKKCAADRDVSAEQAARLLSVQTRIEVTRSAVIGKANRLGVLWEGKTPQVRKKKVVSPRKNVHKGPSRVPKTRGFKPLVEVAVVTREADIIPPKDTRVSSVSDLNESVCRWPCGDPLEKGEFFFCGISTEATGKPYCKFHNDRATRPR